MPQFKQLRSVIAVRHLPTSAAFYRDVLGFTVHEVAPGWNFFQRDGYIIMAGECPDDLPAPEIGSHSYFAYVVMEGIEAYYSHVQARGATLVKPLREEPWGAKEFGVATVDGHRIMFSEVVED